MIIVGCAGVAIIPGLNWASNNGVFRFYTASFLMVHISLHLIRGSVKGVLRRGGAGRGVARPGVAARPRLLHYVRPAAITERYVGQELTKATPGGVSQGAGRQVSEA